MTTEGATPTFPQDLDRRLAGEQRAAGGGDGSQRHRTIHGPEGASGGTMDDEVTDESQGVVTLSAYAPAYYDSFGCWWRWIQRRPELADLVASLIRPFLSPVMADPR